MASAQTQVSAMCKKLGEPSNAVLHQDQNTGKCNMKINEILSGNERGTQNKQTVKLISRKEKMRDDSDLARD